MTEEYEAKKKLLEECRTLGLQILGSVEAVELWLETETDSFWGRSPLDLIQSGSGEHVRSLLEARTK